MRGKAPEVSVSEFVSLINQTLDFAYPQVAIVGEVANFKVSKNRWVYFDLKDNEASVRSFGTVYQLPTPLEDGMRIILHGSPRLHAQFGFSINMRAIQLVGEGTLKKAALLLEAKLRAEGLFDEARKRPLPYPPRNIGLITSAESAAYHDFLKILNQRWGGVGIKHVDVQVQGEAAPRQITSAIEQFNKLAVPPEIIVIIRGGGSPEDLQAFSTEQVTRAVAASRVPTLVAIGHETDTSLSELVADRRASTPSNAAELIVPDRRAVLKHLSSQRQRLTAMSGLTIDRMRQRLGHSKVLLHEAARQILTTARQSLDLKSQILAAYDPQAILQRGYVLVRKNDNIISSGADLAIGASLSLEFSDSHVTAAVQDVKPQKRKQ